MTKNQFQKTVTLALISLSISLLLTSCAAFSSYMYNLTIAYEPPDRVKISKTEDATIAKLPPQINSTSFEGGPVISSDGRYLYFTRSQGSDLTREKIYIAEIEGENYKDAEVLPNPPNMNNQNYIGSLTADRQTLIFVSYQTVTTDTIDKPIYIAKKSFGKWYVADTLSFFKGKKGWVLI